MNRLWKRLRCFWRGYHHEAPAYVHKDSKVRFVDLAEFARRLPRREPDVFVCIECGAERKARW